MRWHLHWSSISWAVPLFRPALLQQRRWLRCQASPPWSNRLATSHAEEALEGAACPPFRGHHGHAFILERVHKQNVFAICTQRKICAPTFSHSPFFRAEKKKTLSQSVHLNVFWGGSVRFGHFGRIPLVPNPFCSKKHQKDRPSFRLSSSPLSPSRLAVWSALWHSENRYDIKTYVGLDILSSYYWWVNTRRIIPVSKWLVRITPTYKP